MNHALADLIAERVAQGLKRKSLNTCSRWSQACRIMGGQSFPGPWSFKNHPWLREMHDSNAEMNIGQKSAQVGFTETALNRTFFKIDVQNVDCLYVLPAQTPDASDFSAARFNPALELSPHLTKLFSDVQNVGHKRAGNTNLYIRGSKSRSGLKSIPVGFIVLDEVDEMDQDNIPLALERTAGQLEKQVWAISTPTIPKFGINKLFLDSTQEHFHFACPCCSKMVELVFPDCLEVTAEDINDEDVENSYLKCVECKGKLDHETKGEWLANGIWVPSFRSRASRGFYVNQMYSPTIHPVSLAKSFLKAQRDPAEEQELYNSKGGLPHIVAGAGVTDADIDRSIGPYRRLALAPDNAFVTMGIDVGRWLHIEIDQWLIPGNIDSTDLNVRSRPKIIWYGKVRDFEELDGLMRQYRINSAVIDANPERRKAYEFASRFYGIVKMCFYGNGVSGKQIHIGKDEEPTITVDRTSWLDLSLGRFREPNTIQLPYDIDFEYRAHLKSLVRIYEKDKSGNPVGRYNNAGDDHYAHARNYAEIALPFAVSFANPQDIQSY
jgi:hypothetical protein